MRSVLLIDDDHITHFITETLIRRMDPDYEILKAANGRDGLELLKNRDERKQPPPNVIFLDLSMPEMDGFEFLQTFVKLTFPGIDRVRVAVLSSSDNPQDQARAKLLGAHYFLTKPASFEQLKGILE